MLDVPGFHVSHTCLFLQAVTITAIELVLEGNAEE